MMLTLIGFAPTLFTLNHKEDPQSLLYNAKTIEWTLKKINPEKLSPESQVNYTLTRNYLDSLIITLKHITSFSQLSKEAHLKVRKEILFIAKKSNGVIKEIESSASAELVAVITLRMSSMFGLPVSTTHVLSSGVAGSMIVGKGKKNLQRKTIRRLLVAWIITNLSPSLQQDYFIPSSVYSGSKYS